MVTAMKTRRKHQSVVGAICDLTFNVDASSGTNLPGQSFTPFFAHSPRLILYACIAMKRAPAAETHTVMEIGS